MLAKRGDFGETYRKPSTASRPWLKRPGKQYFMMKNIKLVGLLVTPVTDWTVGRRKTSTGNLRSSSAINRFVRFACAGDG